MDREVSERGGRLGSGISGGGREAALCPPAHLGLGALVVVCATACTHSGVRRLLQRPWRGLDGAAPTVNCGVLCMAHAIAAGKPGLGLG